jgi:hypothetical protein
VAVDRESAALPQAIEAEAMETKHQRTDPL